MLLIVVVVFILSYSTRFVLFGFCTGQSIFDTTPKEMYKLLTERNFVSVQLGNLVVAVNSAVNILIYYFHDEQFRKIA